MNAEPLKTQNESVLCARPDGGIAVVRIIGRGTYLNSPALKRFADYCQAQNPHTRFILDLERCEYMDSTFMGVIASITIQQRKQRAGMTAVVHATEQSLRLLRMLGLQNVLDIRGAGDAEEHLADTAHWEAADNPEMTKFERTIHMISAHQTLVELGTENEVKFEGVLNYLQDSLERQKARDGK